jgi:hypothetical protein
MIYYCIYKNECLYKDCVYRQTKSKFSNFGAKKDLTINDFTCNLTGKKGTRLISDERIICSKYRECALFCPLKTTYLTRTNFRDYFGHEFCQQEPFKCGTTGETVKLQTAGKSIGNYISIWNQPNLFVKKAAKEE